MAKISNLLRLTSLERPGARRRSQKPNLQRTCSGSFFPLFASNYWQSADDQDDTLVDLTLDNPSRLIQVHFLQFTYHIPYAFFYSTFSN